MDFESYQQEQLEAQVDEIFDDISRKSTQERMAIATFELLHHIDRERVASQELLDAWMNVSGSRPQKKLPYIFGTLAGYANIGLGFAVTGDDPNDAPEQPKEEAPLVKPQVKESEIAKKQKQHEAAKEMLEYTRLLMPEAYNISPRQVKKIETKARKLVESKDLSA